MAKRLQVMTTTLLLLLMVGAGYARAVEPLRICTTTPDLAALAEEIGGEQVSVHSFAKGPEDPHFLDAKPSFIKQLSHADIFIQNGMELESGWVPALLQNARNGKVLVGGRGFIDASRAVQALEVPRTPIDRVQGDVHAQGNPHYLLDPLNGLRVAKLLQSEFSRARPDQAAYFDTRFADFKQRLNKAWIGDSLAAKYGAEKLGNLAESQQLNEFLRKAGDLERLEGWARELQPFTGAKVIVDHNLWVYFASRFQLHIVGKLEPKPGLSPTAKHLAGIIDTMKQEGITVILSSAYFDVRHARVVAQATGAQIAGLAHQVGSRPDTAGYIGMIDYNVRQVKQALGGKAL